MFRLPFFHSEEQFQEEALRFLSLVYSVYEFDSYYVFGDPRDSFHELQWKAEREVAKSIVTLASLARVNDDYGDGLKAHQTRFPTGVGILIEDGVRKPLTSREACNKIIHATDAKWHFKHSSKHPILDSVFKKKGIHPKLKIKRPILELEGAYKKQQWHATLDVIQWVHAVLHFSHARKSP